MIRHIVMWKFREGEEENREKFLSGLQALDGRDPGDPPYGDPPQLQARQSLRCLPDR